MRQRLSQIACVALILCFGAGMAAAQVDTGVRTPGGQRPFADPLYWLNMTPDNRLPIRERLLLPQVGMTAKAPPPTQRAGLTPWVSVAGEANDSGANGDTVLTFAPGLAFRNDGRRLSISGGYAFEAALHGERSDLTRAVQGHGGFVNLTWGIGRRARLTVFDVFSDTRDTRDAPVPGIVQGATRLVSNTLLSSLRYDIDATRAVELGYRNTWFGFDAPALPDLRENAISLRFDRALSEVDLLSAGLAVTNFDFSGAPDATKLLVGATYTRDLGPRLAVTGGLSLAHSQQRDDRTVLGFRGEVVHTDRFARYRLVAERDIISVPGLSNLARSDEISGSALIRLRPGLVLDMRAGYQHIAVFDGPGSTVAVTSASGTLSYAVSPDLWLWTQVELSQEKTGGATRTDNRLIVGVSRSFDR